MFIDMEKRRKLKKFYKNKKYKELISILIKLYWKKVNLKLI
jgi:hypothetical protein